jgi:two-component SAPR family response regulator
MKLREFLEQIKDMDKELEMVFINYYGEVAIISDVAELSRDEIGDPYLEFDRAILLDA